MCQALEKHRPFILEGSLKSDNPVSYRTLVRLVSVPIISEKQWSSKLRGFIKVI
ncbi:MAG: hypothetical protein QGF78_01360 [Candidatus Bathyarchaeota archaeon]|nr:hypothetical protein [Candidatus Bathyarchaeota archaeon]